MERNEEAIIIENKDALKKALIVLTGVIVLFSLQSLTHIEVSIVAIGGAAVLLVITRAPLDYMKLTGRLCSFLQVYLL